MGGINMKQFNLQEYLKNPTKKVITRDGRSVKIICTNAKGNFPIIALVETYNGNETVLRLKENGRFYNDTENSSDLFFAPVKKEGWINLFKVNSTLTIGEVYNTEEEAKSAIAKSLVYISTVKIEWEE